MNAQEDNLFNRADFSDYRLDVPQRVHLENEEWKFIIMELSL
jgi:hypothetical protein